MCNFITFCIKSFTTMHCTTPVYFFVFFMFFFYNKQLRRHSSVFAHFSFYLHNLIRQLPAKDMSYYPLLDDLPSCLLYP